MPLWEIHVCLDTVILFETSLTGFEIFTEYNEAAARLLSRALKDRLISVVTRGSQTSPSSLEIKWEAELKNAIKGIIQSIHCARLTITDVVLNSQGS